MARFSVFLSIAVVAVVALYTNQVLAQNSIIVADEDYNSNNCSEPDASDCIGKEAVKGCRANLCCKGLQYSAAEDGNGSLMIIRNGTCTCCTKGYCLTQYSAAQGSTPSTQSEAQALNVQCKLPAV